MTNKVINEDSNKSHENYQIRFMPFDINVPVPHGTTILDAIKIANIPIKATCGGKCTCGDCIIQILSGAYKSRPCSALSKNLIGKGYALACNTKITDNLVIQMPEFKELSIKTVSDSKFFKEHPENISGVYEVAPPLLDVLDSSKKNIYGIACDIGTTTIALNLVDLKNGKIINTTTGLNQQIKCGEDIISRINYSEKPGQLLELHKLIIMTINRLIKEACNSSKISFQDIYYASVTGNTTMIHFFLNLEASYIRLESAVPSTNQAPLILSRDLGLAMNHATKIHCAPSVGSYVGGDITAGLLCTPLLCDSEKIFMFIDIGTNGELVIGNNDWLMTCACSAGPAFEGKGIKCGMPATNGAIFKLKLSKKGEPKYKVIGDCKPAGLCGSALIDLLSELFINGFINRQGKFNENKASGRIIETESGKGFLIENKENCYWEKDLIITENDITNLIRTKGAVFSACSLLVKKVGIDFNKIDSFYIAGGFGQNLNIENAIRIGLFPDLARDKFHYVGNSSLLGAYLTLLSDKNKNFLKDISKKMTYIELNQESDYMDKYTGALFLPHTNMDLFPSIKKIYNPKTYN